MPAASRTHAAAGAALVGAGVVVATPVATPVAQAQAQVVGLTAGEADAPLGGGTAFAIGGSGMAVPPPIYAQSADSIYLAPLGFTGHAQSLFTPEGLYPVTGVKSLPTDTSFAQGQQILDATIHGQINTGGVSATDPVVVFGWSQSSSIAGLTMPQLHSEGVPSDDVRFVLVGDPSAPNGGALERFDFPINGEAPTIPSLGITFSGATPSDLYPTDIYTIEYDGFADYPQYPIDLLSDLNAMFGLILAHAAYMGLTPEQLTPVADGGQAIQQATSSADTLTNYYMIPNDQLPLLQLLQLFPVVGQPLYDLLEPDTRVLVNLGYGDIDHGWSQGDADVPTQAGLFPDVNPGQVLTALGHGLQQGIDDAAKQLANPDSYKPVPILDNPALSTLLASAHNAGLDLSSSTTPSSPSSLLDIVNAFSGRISDAYSVLLADADTLNAIFTTLPAYDASIFVEQLKDGNLLDAVGLPVAADTGLIPFAVTFGMLLPLASALSGVSI